MYFKVDRSYFFKMRKSLLVDAAGRMMTLKSTVCKIKVEWERSFRYLLVVFKRIECVKCTGVSDIIS